ncbi:hypothetical protein FGO68_gene6930 [Halteria grandinella]|uniref:Oxidation resistance protein 1 n=1 Tax=Halteria grandinella TaxID=5974 RepID=A0A8J8T754_HALGN|nr:hypothetical protein FGO68_gene6930 [Halteria grandinella]
MHLMQNVSPQGSITRLDSSKAPLLFEIPKHFQHPDQLTVNLLVQLVVWLIGIARCLQASIGPGVRNERSICCILFFIKIIKPKIIDQMGNTCTQPKQSKVISILPIENPSNSVEKTKSIRLNDETKPNISSNSENADQIRDNVSPLDHKQSHPNNDKTMVAEEKTLAIIEEEEEEMKEENIESTIEDTKQIYIEKHIVTALMRLQAPMMYVNTMHDGSQFPQIDPPPPEAELIMKNPSRIPEVMEKKNLIALWFNTRNLKLDLLFQSSVHGLNFNSFHRQCGGKKNLLIFVKSKVYNQVFGGFTSIKLSIPSGDEELFYYHRDPNAFIFQLTKGTKHDQLKHKYRAIFHYKKDNLIGFGGGNDFYISEDSDTIGYSSSFFGRNRGSYCYTYQLPSSISENTSAGLKYLAGATLFQVSEMEVYQVSGFEFPLSEPLKTPR